MKYLKMLGLAAMAAAALAAFLGAGTASATVICKTVPVGGVCPEGWAYPVGTEGTATSTNSLKLVAGGITLDTCTGSTVSSSIKSAGSATSTVTSTLSTLTLGACTNETTVLNPGSAELHWIPGTNNGTLTTIGTQVTVRTIFGSCVYTVRDAGTTEGGNPGTLTLNTQPTLISGPCPSESQLTGAYVATSPKNAWVAER
ncbi:MAG: hypothetical protein ACTHNP_10935 [Solirubrobacterales bacterium]